MEIKQSGILADGSDRVVIDPNPPVIEPEVIEHGLEIPTEPIVTDDDMVADYVEDGGEITYFDEIQQEAFTSELMYQGETGNALFQQIKSDNFMNEDFSLTVDTIAKAKAHGMTDEDINNHQQSLLKQLDTQRNKIFSDAGYANNQGYIVNVIDWAKDNFTADEMNLFIEQTNENPTKSLNSLDEYYLHVMNGGER